ncbi:MAG: hypothetical protein JOY67_10245 [Hyphomicrobiales bacterium]|nr:hypothetical protein [Hyphomicrobiales bacterium]MBV9518579.1 hypothetical protein [Hyphomicrobiales bacterium]
MSQTTLPESAVEASVSGVSWGAAAAGAVVIAALSLMLLAFGAGMGFSAVSPWSGSGVSATTLSVVAGIYLLVAACLSSAVGGYIAGRLRRKWARLHTHEVYFRDTAHGFIAWAFATVITAAFLASASTNIAGGATAGLAQATGRQASGSPVDYYADALLRPSGAPASTADNRGEVLRILTNGLREGDVSAPDRSYLAQLIAGKTGLSQGDAEKRVGEVIDQAKAAADAARKAAARFSLWLAASLLLGAFAASLAATEGGQLRDRSDIEI